MKSFPSRYFLLKAHYYCCKGNNSDILPKKWYFWTKLINIWILQKSHYLIVCPAPFLLLWFRRSVGRNKNSLIRFCSQQISILYHYCFWSSTIANYSLLQCCRCQRLDVNPYLNFLLPSVMMMLQMPLDSVDFSAIKLISANCINFFPTQIQYGSFNFLKLVETAPLPAPTCYNDDVAAAICLTLTHTAGPWHMRFYRLGKICMSQIRMTKI